MSTDLSAPETFPEIREAVRKLCARFPGPYWRALDRERAYPTAFVTALTEAGFLSVLIPEEYGGSGLGLAAGAAVLEEIHRSGCNGGACHAQMYTMGTLLRHGTPAQKTAYLPKIAAGELRLQAFGVTEPDAGTDTTRITTFARTAIFLRDQHRQKPGLRQGGDKRCRIGPLPVQRPPVRAGEARAKLAHRLADFGKGFGGGEVGDHRPSLCHKGAASA